MVNFVLHIISIVGFVLEQVAFDFNELCKMGTVLKNFPYSCSFAKINYKHHNIHCKFRGKLQLQLILCKCAVGETSRDSFSCSQLGSGHGN